MPEIVEIPIELNRFQLPQAVHARLQFLLDCQDEGCTLSQAERQEAKIPGDWKSRLHKQSLPPQAQLSPSRRTKVFIAPDF